jgi:hypothetical protein
VVAAPAHAEDEGDEASDEELDGAPAAGCPLLAAPHPAASSAAPQSAATILLFMGLRLPVRQQVMLPRKRRQVPM